MLLTLCILLLAMALISYSYHQLQNSKASIGGKISVAKSFWLAYALFHYFIYPIIFYFHIHQTELKQLLLLLIFWFYLRMLAQGLMMFAVKNWSPKYGIGHNILSVLLIGFCLIYVGINHLTFEFEEMTMVSFFLFNLMLISMVDTIYARKFHRLIGEKTKGEQAIWYASDDVQFDKINQLTTRNNYFFVLISIVLIVLLLLYDKP